jgi:hypothetical protein
VALVALLDTLVIVKYTRRRTGFRRTDLFLRHDEVVGVLLTRASPNTARRPDSAVIGGAPSQSDSGGVCLLPKPIQFNLCGSTRK